jgi:hypothetical protein
VIAGWSKILRKNLGPACCHVARRVLEFLLSGTDEPKDG